MARHTLAHEKKKYRVVTYVNERMYKAILKSAELHDRTVSAQIAYTLKYVYTPKRN